MTETVRGEMLDSIAGAAADLVGRDASSVEALVECRKGRREKEREPGRASHGAKGGGQGCRSKSFACFEDSDAQWVN